MIDTPSQDTNAKARRAAFTCAYDEHAHYFLMFFYRRTGGDIAVARDLSQKFWISIYRRFHVDNLLNLRFLTRRANDIQIEYYRRNTSRAWIEPTNKLPDTQFARYEYSPAEERMLQDAFWHKFPHAEITEQEKEVFWLNVHIGHTLEEIAKKYSVSAPTIHNWINRVKEQCVASSRKENHNDR